MKRFPLLVIGAALLVLIGGLVFFSRQNKPASSPLPQAYEYFSSPTCPHCAVVDGFLEGWEGKDKIKIEKKEVLNNRENINLFYQRGEYCQIPRNQLGVPFLFTPEGECILGDQPIIDYLQGLSL